MKMARLRSDAGLLGTAVVVAVFASACGSNGSTTPATAPSPTVTALSIAGNPPAVGASAQFTATATLSDGVTQDVTAQAAWTSANTAIATVSATGMVTGMAAGDDDVRATYQSFTGSRLITIAVAPAPPAPAPPGSPTCAYTLSIGSTIDGYPNGGSFPVTVSAAATCAWTATTNVSWIHIPTTASGTGTGSFTFSMDSNSGSVRSGTLAIAGQTVTVTQSAQPLPNCVTSISPTSVTVQDGAPVDSSGGSGVNAVGSVTVTAPASCSWTATSSASFITVTSGAAGVGPGTVAYAIAPNSTQAQRTGTLTVGGLPFAVTQQFCTWVPSPTTFTFPTAGGSGTVSVAAPSACTWFAYQRTTNASDGPALASLPSGTKQGNGTFTFDMPPNSGYDMFWTIRVSRESTYSNGRSGLVSVSQHGALGPNCQYNVSRPASVTASGATVTVTVSVPVGINLNATGVIDPTACGWTAASNASFLTIVSGGSGAGNGSVSVAVAPNSGSARTGTLTIGGQTVTVTQSGP